MNKLNIIQCHIRKEFDNQLLIEYFVKNSKNTFWYFVSPQSQGSVDDFNKTKQNYLIFVKDSTKNEFDLEDWIHEFLIKTRNTQ